MAKKETPKPEVAKGPHVPNCYKCGSDKITVSKVGEIYYCGDCTNVWGHISNIKEARLEIERLRSELAALKSEKKSIFG